MTAQTIDLALARKLRRQGAVIQTQRGYTPLLDREFDDLPDARDMVFGRGQPQDLSHLAEW